jgi:ATP-dependent Lon protease
MVPSDDSSSVAANGSATANGNGPVASLPSDALILLPARQLVLFPGLVMPITIGRPKSIAAIQQAVREQRQIGIVLQREPGIDDPGPDDLYRIGTLANVVRYITAPDGTHHVIVQGVQRIRILDVLPGTPFPTARVAHIPEPDTRSSEIEARFRNLQNQALEAMELLPQAPQELIAAIQGATSPAALADLAAGYMDVPVAEKQQILETVDLTARIERVSQLLAERIEVMRLTQEIGRQTKVALDERQKEAVLREQMAAIQRQLGESDGKSEEVAELTEAIAKAHMPAEVEAQARKELNRYQRMPEAAAEFLGGCQKKSRSISRLREKFSMKITLVSKRSRTGSSNILRFGSSHPMARRRFFVLSVRRASARHRSVNPSHGPWIGRLSVSAWAVFTTKQRFAVIVARMSARCPETSFRRSEKPARAIA